jgi:hypothetical protein
MKKTILVIFAATLTFALVGCGGGTTSTDTTTPPITDPTAPPVTDPTAPPVTDPTAPPVTDPILSVALNSVTLENYDAVTDGIYHTSNPGAIKINYNVSYSTNDVHEYMTIKVQLSNSATVANAWNEFYTAQNLGDAIISDATGTTLSTATNQTGSLITRNDAAYVMIQPVPYTDAIDYTKPTYLVVTLYSIDTSIPIVIPADPLSEPPVYVPTYVYSQKAIPITILP